MKQKKQEEKGKHTQHTDGLNLYHNETYRMSSCFDANNRNIHTHIRMQVGSSPSGMSCDMFLQCHKRLYNQRH